MAEVEDDRGDRGKRRTDGDADDESIALVEASRPLPHAGDRRPPGQPRGKGQIDHGTATPSQQHGLRRAQNVGAEGTDPDSADAKSGHYPGEEDSPGCQVSQGL